MPKDKYVLVTGANAGTGFEIAKKFLQKGALVGAHYYGGEVDVKSLFEFAKAGQLGVFAADFSKPEEVSRLWQEFISWSKGRIDILVNNAAAIGQSDKDWDMVFQVNVKAPFFLSKLAFELMVKQKSGRIINMSSISVKSGTSLAIAHYAASKAALESFTKSFAKAGAEFNILVNAVRPGVTDSPLHKKLAESDPSFKVPFIQPKEIAKVVVSLASPKSSLATDTIIEVRGGQ